MKRRKLLDRDEPTAMKPKHCAIAMLILLSVFCPLSVHSAESRSEAVAQEAHKALEAHCAWLHGTHSSPAVASEQIVQLSQLWRKVSETFETDGADFLLYWRGTLAQCLSQDAIAVQDLKKFLQGAGKRAEFHSMAEDARRRLVILENPDGSTTTRNKAEQSRKKPKEKSEKQGTAPPLD